MDFFTKEQEEKLLFNGHTDNRDQDHAPVVKLFMPGTQCAWLLSEIDPDEPDTAFGLCDLGFPELGYVSLHELAEINFGEITVVRDDRFVSEYPMSVYLRAARGEQSITDDKFALMQAYEEENRRTKQSRQPS